MCASGKIKCVSAVTGFTVDQEYVVASLGDNAVTTVDDNGDVKSVSVNGTNFEFSELYVPVKVV